MKALSREQIHALSDEDLSKALSPQEMKMIVNLTRLSFNKAIPKKLETEGTGEYRRRIRESKKVDAAEFGLAARLNAEGALYNSQRKQRLLDALSSNITPESIAARKKADAERAERDNRRDLEGDHMTSVPYARMPVAEWEPK